MKKHNSIGFSALALTMLMGNVMATPPENFITENKTSFYVNAAINMSKLNIFTVTAPGKTNHDVTWKAVKQNCPTNPCSAATAVEQEPPSTPSPLESRSEFNV